MVKYRSLGISFSVILVLLAGVSGCGKSVKNGSLPISPDEAGIPSITPGPGPTHGPHPGKPPGKFECSGESQVKLWFTQRDPVVMEIRIEPGELTGIQDVWVDDVPVEFTFDSDRSLIQLLPGQTGTVGSQITVRGCMDAEGMGKGGPHSHPPK